MNYVTSATITNRIFHNENVLELIVVPDMKIKYNPGSFVQLTLEKVSASERWPESRTFSIASYSNEHLRFLIKKQGDFTNRLFCNTKLNQIITLKYPFGEMFSPKTVDSNHVFIAGGLGITPFIGLTEYFSKMNKLKNLTLFYSAKFMKELIYMDYFIDKISDLHLHVTKEDSEYNSFRIKINQVLEYANPETHFYICGSNNFIQFFKSSLSKEGITNIHIDEWV